MADDSTPESSSRPGKNLAQGAIAAVRDGFVGTTHIVEDVHGAVLNSIRRVNPLHGPINAVTRTVYRDVRDIGRAAFALSGQAAGLVSVLLPTAGGPDARRGQVALVSALNGAFGDHFETSGNPLTLHMGLRKAGGQRVPVTTAGLRQALETPSRRLVILVHGLGMNDRQWQRGAMPDFGERLEQDLGYSSLRLRYNTGRHISTNGRDLARLLERLVDVYPAELENLTLIGHSMGGLVARSACHYGREENHRWVAQLTELVCLGSPHLGAPLEKLGNAVTHSLTRTPFTAPLSRVGNIRSAGVKDLRFGYILDDDWDDKDPDAPGHKPGRPSPLLDHVRYFFIAATVGKHPKDRLNHWIGDLLVPVKSASGIRHKPNRRSRIGHQHGRVFYDMNHFALVYHPEVYAAIETWLTYGKH
ncbi:MAG: hypothetical protein CMN28_15890 [Salinisphaeraceae bacterium]|nr:hypothetical protein [Salinisphaeraceae bacterium]